MENSDTCFDCSKVQNDLGLFRGLYIAALAVHVENTFNACEQNIT